MTVVTGGSGWLNLTPTTTKLEKHSNLSLSSPPPPRHLSRVNLNRRRYPPPITASLSSPPSPSPLSVSSTGFPPSIKIPDIKFYPSRFVVQFFNNSYISRLIGDRTGSRGKLHMLKLRISIRDDDGVIADTFASFWSEVADALHKTNNIANRNETAPSMRLLATRICGFLLEHVDSWICGYSYVLFVESDFNFDFELKKLETVFDHYTNRENTATTVPSAELNLGIAVYGNICDREIHSRDQLVDVLQQLSSLNPTPDREDKDSILYVMPLCKSDCVSKEKVDQKEGYAHISLGKIR